MNEERGIEGNPPPAFEVGTDRIGVGREEEKEREELRAELAETEERLVKIDAEIRKLEAAARAPRTPQQDAELSSKLAKARDQAEKAWGGDQEMITRLLEATKKAYMEGREGIGAKLENLRQRKEDLEAQKALIGQKLRGEKPS